MNRKNQIFKFTILSVILFLMKCNSFQVIPEPNLEKITVKSETICTEFVWYSPFCTAGKAKSLMVKGIYNNLTGEKKYYLDYYLDLLDTDLPVGISLNLDGTYYNLRKMSADYTEIVKLESELNADVIAKIKATKNDIGISYSNRTDTTNFGLSSGKTESLKNQLSEVIKQVNSSNKLKIIK